MGETDNRVHEQKTFLQVGKRYMLLHILWQKKMQKTSCSKKGFFLNLNKFSNNEVTDNVSNILVFNAILDQTA